jgi:hypothetical protein
VAGQKRCSFTAIGIRIGNWVGDEFVSMVTDKMQGEWVPSMGRTRWLFRSGWWLMAGVDLF